MLMQVKKKLKDLPDSGGAERNELESLVNSLDEFSAALIHPLKSDHDSRDIFRSCLDGIMEKAIDTEHKKVLELGKNNIINEVCFIKCLQC